MRTLDIMRYIDRNEYRMDYCVLSGQSGDLDDDVRNLGGQVHYLPLSDPWFSLRFMELVKCHKYSIVHSHVHYASGALLALAALAGSSIRIVHFRNSSDGRGNTIYRRFYRNVLRKLIRRYATHILAVSRSAMDDAWEADWCSDHRCTVVYNGIDPGLFSASYDDGETRRELGFPADAPLYIHVGRFDPAKNHLRALLIFAEVARLNPTARLLLVGRGGTALEQQARAFVRNNSLQANVTFAGLRSDVPRLMSAADVLLFPSLWEGLPGVVLEAGAVGIPVVASDLPVIKEIADYLPLLRYLSLTTPDSAWAERSLKLIAESKAPVVRERARQAFEGSPFTVQSALKLYQSVWRGGH